MEVQQTNKKKLSIFLAVSMREAMTKGFEFNLSGDTYTQTQRQHREGSLTREAPKKVREPHEVGPSPHHQISPFVGFCCQLHRGLRRNIDEKKRMDGYQ